MLEEIKISSNISGNYLDSFLDDRDALLMKIVLKYFAVLVSERNSYLEQLRRETILCNISRRQCIINREIQVLLCCCVLVFFFLMLAVCTGFRGDSFS